MCCQFSGDPKSEVLPTHKQHPDGTGARRSMWGGCRGQPCLGRGPPPSWGRLLAPQCHRGCIMSPPSAKGVRDVGHQVQLPLQSQLLVSPLFSSKSL